MNRSSFVILCTVFVAIAVGIVAQWRTHARLVNQLDAVRQQNQMDAHQRMRVDQSSPPKSDAARPPENTSTDTPRFVGSVAQGPAVVRMPAEASTSIAGLVRAENWKNAGRQTPSAAFETLEWALDRGETATLAASLTFNPDVKTKLDELFANLSPEVRSKYNTPESIIALLVTGTSKGPQAFQVLDETFQGPDVATVRVR